MIWNFQNSMVFCVLYEISYYYAIPMNTKVCSKTTKDINFVSVPPSVRAVPTTGQLTARKGGAVTLECKASGNPVPSITWTKKVSVFKKCFIQSHKNFLPLFKCFKQHPILKLLEANKNQLPY